LLAPGFPSRDGPYTPAVVDTVAAIGARHEVEVHALRGRLEDRGRAKYRGLTVEAYGRGQVAAQLARLAANVAGRRFDLVWSLWGAHTGAPGVFAASLVRRPLVVSLMGAELARIDRARYGALFSPKSRAELRAAFRKATCITTGSERQREQLTRFAPAAAAKAVVAPLGIDPGRIPRSTRQPWRAGQPLSLLAVADTSPVKCLDLAIATVSLLLRQGVETTLDVYGHDHSRRWSTLSAGTGTAVRHRGFVPAADLHARFACHDALLHTSLHESQGLALIESAAAGLPIASLDVGVAPDLGRLGATIEIAGDPDPSTFARAVVAAAARGPGETSGVRERFSLEVTVPDLERILVEAARC
jgi:glycosyltransferase involved in cell wall biosynthesis